MELAIAPRVLPSLPQSRLLTPKPILRTAVPFRARLGVVRSSSGSGWDIWSTASTSEETPRIAVADKDDAPLEKEEEVKEEVADVAEVKEEEVSSKEVSVDAEVKEEAVSSEEVSVEVEVKEEAVSSEAVSEEESPVTDLLKELNINLDSEDKSKLLVYGAGALVVLWISSVVVSAVDSIPLFPKLMELVGLGYTVWFSSRYLLFKGNREELFSKIIELKDKIL